MSIKELIKDPQIQIAISGIVGAITHLFVRYINGDSMKVSKWIALWFVVFIFSTAIGLAISHYTGSIALSVSSSSVCGMFYDHVKKFVIAFIDNKTKNI